MAAMSGRPTPGASDADVFVISARGSRQLKASAGTTLTKAELALLVLIDGVSTLEQIAGRLPGLRRELVDESIGKLRAAGLVVSIAELDAGGEDTAFSTISVPAGFFSSITASASAEANDGASLLTKKGYFVRIAQRPNPEKEIKAGWQPTILVVDDDPDLQKLIGMFLKMEGFNTRHAQKKDEILAALRQSPMPDLILLDVQMPDANGFAVLAKFREHPVLKAIPVVMFTAEATREAVLKGLQLGAEGYVTKPFEPEAVVNAVKAVLGLSPPADDKKKK